MDTQEQRPEPQGERADEILQAARHIFAAEGFERATIQRVAETAGIAKGTVYLYYRSKEELYWATMRHGLEELHRQSAAAIAAAPTTAARLRAFVATRLRYLDDNRDFFGIYFSVLGQTRSGSPAPELEALYLTQVDVLEGLIAEGMAAGELRADLRPRTTAFAILDLTRSLVGQRVRGWSKAAADDDLEMLVAMLWTGIGR